ncbi:MAG: aminoacyl-tRNA hydrolase [Holosporales bacterium]|jgi:PTH1 family peptidyl-tRNA hydrolase|nr:aminoacyl-tRNA hydrolase [Holosporales bacterium]
MIFPSVVVGLGNPGDSYAEHRHNAGCLALQEIARHWRFPIFTHKKNFALSQGEIAEHRVFLLKPLTFMNDSGQAVGACASFYKLSSESFLVLHDDLGLPSATLRLKQGGGHGGHNGLRSLDAVLGPGYWRLRIGIGHPGARDLVTHYVLSPFSTTEKDHLAEVFSRIAQHLPLFLQGEPHLFFQALSS